MEIIGRVQNGVIVFDSNLPLPEGASVSIFYPSAPAAPTRSSASRVELPLVHCHEAEKVDLTNEQIAEIMDDEDIAS